MNSISKKVIVAVSAALFLAFIVVSIVSHQLQSKAESEQWKKTEQNLKN